MTSTESLIQDLAADLVPVRRREVRREIIALLALGAAELALLLMVHGFRSDFGQVILSPYMVWKIGSLALLAGMACAIAIRSFTPPAQSGRGLEWAAALACVVIVAGAFVTPAGDGRRALLDRLAPAHGLLCMVSIVVLALPIMGQLAVLMRRAAPVHPKRSALAVGLAASLCGALIFTTCCPMNDPLYITVWYSAGIAAVTAAARWLLPQRFRL